VKPRFDELIHPSTRLSIVALLAAADWAEFSFIRDALNLSDSALSKQLSTLGDAGYLVVERISGDRHRRLRVCLTATGRVAFDGHIAAIQKMAAAAAGRIETLGG
jgi:DNA-binding transcriptional ArsR family regulator